MHAIDNGEGGPGIPGSAPAERTVRASRAAGIGTDRGAIVTIAGNEPAGVLLIRRPPEEGHAVLHLSVISPSNKTAQVLETLAADSGAVHVTLARDASVDPPGDLIAAYVARGHADHILAALEELDLVDSGAVAFGPAGTVLSEAGRRAGATAAGSSDGAVVWAQLLGQAREHARLTPTMLIFLTIAFLLSAVGVATASPLTLVGAMVVGPEFRPLSALAVGLVRRDTALVRTSAQTLAVSFPIAMAVTALATLLWVRLGWIGTDDVENARAFDFIYQVGPFSAIVALLAGAAGMLAMVTYSSTVLVGVFISVTTVPAAGLAVVAAIAGKWSVVSSSLVQLGVNLVGIVLAGVAVLLLLRRQR
ncbi:DUF389 domain-containing protein [Nocardia thailandica]|uniref:DUF389 domain-containing protein n=1 Tax=Nocardia thailandica TaxID=257275 RepID=UPI001FE0682A|nr:DUF389 domain-containing protein [Nocardia thailandica]